MSEKNLFIRSMKMVDFDGSNNVPTVLSYTKDGKCSIGNEAISQYFSNKHIFEMVNDFKVHLGNIVPGSTIDKSMHIPTGNRRSALGCAGDFTNIALKQVKSWLEDQGITSCESIMLAEPLTMKDDLVTNGWIQNYRKNLTRLLSGKFKKIDFLPEPFAVFQYYRYGEKHPYLRKEKKHQALVVDFGGGTFDVCVVESKKDGDISQTGRNNKPLAADSTPIGGFFINREITSFIINKYVSNKYNSVDIKKGEKNYLRWKNGELDIESLNEKNKNFILNFHELAMEAEQYKLAICQNIEVWDLDRDQSNTSVSINYIEKPFTDVGERRSGQIDGNELKDVFIEKVWNPRLKGIVKSALRRAEIELDGAPITSVLLSGGSSNIGWLSELIRRDFGHELRDAELFKLDDYQEVVSKGLAIECARRFFTEGGDFASTTYNRLCLVLDPDSKNPQIKKYKAVSGPEQIDQLPPGTLLPAATILRKHLNKEIFWKVRLDNSPKKKMDYYYLLSSLNKEDIKNLQNVEEQSLVTPKDCSFEKQILVSLTVRDDGTAFPKFIYKRDKFGSPVFHVEGRPFYLDMTSGDDAPSPNAYIGFDFGSSNSSFSFINQKSIQIYEERKLQGSWDEISELIDRMPYPVSIKLANYIAESHPENLGKRALEFVEASLTFAGYIAYSEFCSSGQIKNNSKIFKGFSKRSAGPLMKLLRESMLGLCKEAYFSKHFIELTNNYNSEIDEAIFHLNNFKHDRESMAGFDHQKIVKIVANVLNKVFSENKFGYFTNVKKQKFGQKCEGIFRIAHGNMPFVHSCHYKGNEQFSEDQTFLFDTKNGRGILLQPLMFWDQCSNHSSYQPGHLFLYDKEEKGKHHFMTLGYPCNAIAEKGSDYEELFNNLQKMKNIDISTHVFKMDAGCLS